MEKTIQDLENKAQEAVKEAADQAEAAVQALTDDELDRVAGGESEWGDDVPKVAPKPHPVKPNP